mmetsp:Transcript_11109/g.27328  ORF Transcript_11109/g.27328 Transcript_11109/m.27328 type:complete len:87 (+) Transcript_11109:51-311(+)
MNGMHSLLTVTLILRIISHCHAFGSSAGKLFPSTGVSLAEGTAIGSRGKNTMTPPISAPGIMSSPSQDQFRIGYLSDIEGHWDYFL